MSNQSRGGLIGKKERSGDEMLRTGIDEEDRQFDYVGSGWANLRDAALGSLVLVTTCGHLSAFTDTDISGLHDLYSSPRLSSVGTEFKEVSEEIGTSPESETVQFDYIEQDYDVRDLAETLNSRSRGFTKEEASDYGDFLDSIFE